MKYLKKLATPASCLALMLAALTTNTNASEWNRKTVVTISGPIEIPGVHLSGWGTLPAGTYVFKVMDSQSNRHIVQIFSQDEKTIYATILSVPNYRLKATDKTVITFSERPAGEPEALRAWFYPGRNWGEEFVYPKARAMALAKATNTPVLFTPADMPVEVTEPIKPANETLVSELDRAPIKAVQPTGEEVELAQVVTPPPAQSENLSLLAQASPAPVAAAAAEPAGPTPMLPETASHLPQIAVGGFLALASALALLAVRKRIAP
jgi:hypothetical protein